MPMQGPATGNGVQPPGGGAPSKSHKKGAGKAAQLEQQKAEATRLANAARSAARLSADSFRSRARAFQIWVRTGHASVLLGLATRLGGLLLALEEAPVAGLLP